VGEAGDSYERNADAIADRVVAGKSATDLLAPFKPGSSSGALQKQEAGGGKEGGAKEGGAKDKGKELEGWAKTHGIPTSGAVIQQLYDNRALTLEQYANKFKRASGGPSKERIPHEARKITVDEALKRGKVGTVDVRKMLSSADKK
jgi:hypothetical protein